MSKRIELTQGKFAIVDDEDYEWLSQWKWQVYNCSQTYYAGRCVYLGGGRKNRKLGILFMHRQILGLDFGDKRQADHGNHNGWDNRRCNIKIVTCQQNHFNRKGVKGYCWDKHNKAWKAAIKLNYKSYNLGLFNSKKEARKAYLCAKKKYHKII